MIDGVFDWDDPLLVLERQNKGVCVQDRGKYGGYMDICDYMVFKRFYMSQRTMNVESDIWKIFGHTFILYF